ncbi:MAG: ABC transporter ATP-binding protein [Candidatus Ornithomonoglobus sp.]
MIEVSNLVKHYGDKKAVDGITFTVHDNEVLGFLGPNGAGKSTTMNMLTGYISMTSGEIKINGIDILQNPIEAKKQIGYLPEQPPLYPEMTVTEYLGFVSELKGVKDIKAEIKSIAEKTGLSKVLRRRTGNLSKGYKQRVGLAAALAGDPKVLILDEPTVGLDPNQIIDIRGLIRSLGKDHTVILSSHILSEISAVCGRVLIINNGRIAAEDTPEKLARQESKNKVKRIIIRADGSDEAVKAVLDGFTDVTYTRLDGEGEYALDVAAGKDISKQLFFAFAKAELAILEQHEEELSLEDVFIELTKKKGDS